MHFTGFSLLFLTATLVSVACAVISYKRLTSRGAKELAILMSVAAYWCFWVFFETAAVTQEMKIFWSKVSYPAVVSAPIFFYLFALKFTGGEKFSSFRKAWPLFIVPLIVVLLAWTNELHGLIWKSFSPIDPETNLLVYRHGIVFLVLYAGYSYFFMFLATIRIVRHLFRRERVYRSQGWVLFLGSVFPWLASFLYLTNANIVPGFDLTPGSFLFSTLLFLYALLKIQLLELVPIAREVLVESLTDGILALDGKNRILDINPSAVAFLGMEHSKPTGMILSDCKVREPLLRNVILDDRSTELFELKTDRGSLFYRIERLSIKTDTNNRLIVIHDVTDRVTKERKIQSVREQMLRMYHTFRLMADSVPEMIWAKDTNLNYLFVNEALCKRYLMAESLEEPIGKNERFFQERIQNRLSAGSFDDTLGQHSEETDELVLSGMKTVQYDESGVYNGENFHWDIRKSPMYDQEGKLIGLVGIAHDITQQKKAENDLVAAKERAEESDRLKTAFLGNLSHEIRTPMNGILGFVNILEDSSLSLEEKNEYFGLIRESGKRLITTINDIIDISRIETGQISLKYVETDLNETVHMLMNVYSKEADKKNLSLVFTGAEGFKDQKVVTDRAILFNILSNLIKNGIKYTNQGFVEFGCAVEAEHFSFYVKDTGIGIAREKYDSIFDRFVQADNSNTRIYEGNGLGLSITKSYIEMLGGRIWLESEVGQGSTFYVRIPCQSDATGRVDPDESAVGRHLSPHRRILVVEDDHSNFDYLRLILQQAGYEVQHTITGFEAIEKCRQHQLFDLILMDVKLPGIDGYETTRRIRTILPDLPIIAVSAFAFAEDREKAALSGCNEYLTKPVDKRALLEMLVRYFPQKP